MYWFLKILAWLPLTILFPTIVKKKAKLPKGKAVIVCNHLSNTDVFVVHIKLGCKPYTLAKKELFNSKCKTKLLKSLGAIPVDREKVELSTLKESLNVLKNNKKLLIFPEGTRNKNGDDLQQLKNGAAMFAIKNGAPVIPMWIKNKPRLFCFNKLTIGEPFTLNFDSIDKDNLTKAGKIIEEKMLQLKQDK